MQKIASLSAREILDSRGDPTVEVELETEGGIGVIASVPSGASVGSHEAVELRDKDENRYGGLGVLKAVDSVNKTIFPVLKGQDVTNQKAIDQILIEVDGTPHKSNLGANAILAVSIAVCKAASKSKGIPLYRYIEEISNSQIKVLPRPMFNFIEGAKHADNNLELQEFLVITEGSIFSDNLRFASERFHELKNVLKNRGLSVAVGHEGGFAPILPSDEEALKMISDLNGVKMGLDMAGVMPNSLSIEKIVNNFPILSLEDPATEDDWESWVEITQKIGEKVQIVGDDIFATDIARLKTGIEKKAANAVIIKPNQVGTISQTIEFANLAKTNNYKTVVSHRSGETEDTFISDFAVGIAADFVKFGAPSRGERICKYNRLLRIEEDLK